MDMKIVMMVMIFHMMDVIDVNINVMRNVKYVIKVYVWMNVIMDII